jgi:hypothetical protein
VFARPAAYWKEVMSCRSLLWLVVSGLAAIPISWTIPSRTLRTALAAPAGAIYQSFAPIRNR